MKKNQQQAKQYTTQGLEDTLERPVLAPTIAVLAPPDDVITLLPTRLAETMMQIPAWNGAVQ